MKTKKSVKYFQVRFYPNSTFKTVEVLDYFHECHLTDIMSHYNGDTKERYEYLVAEEKNIQKAKKKIAKTGLKEAKKALYIAQKKVVLFNRILNECL